MKTVCSTIYFSPFQKRHVDKFVFQFSMYLSELLTMYLDMEVWLLDFIASSVIFHSGSTILHKEYMDQGFQEWTK